LCFETVFQRRRRKRSRAPHRTLSLQGILEIITIMK
jgi:hypothetical protein